METVLAGEYAVMPFKTGYGAGEEPVAPSAEESFALDFALIPE